MPDRSQATGQPGSSGCPVFISPKLSRRQREVVSLVAIGCTDQEIAVRLMLSIWTVKDYLRKAQAVLEARDRTHAAVKALLLGLIQIDATAANSAV